jgi:hypothetical protein
MKERAIQKTIFDMYSTFLLMLGRQDFLCHKAAVLIKFGGGESQSCDCVA